MARTVTGLGFRVKGLGFGVWGLGFGVARTVYLLQYGTHLGFRV